MIPVLYNENETNFEHNGLGLLSDAISCYAEEVRNGAYELELIYPVNSEMYKDIKTNRWIKAKANDRYEPQIFRIYYISLPISGQITVRGEHISYLLKDNFIENLSYTGNCNEILNSLSNAATFQTGFTFYSDVNESKSINFDLRNFWECIIGKDDSIISQFGTGIDIVRNNKKISLLKSGGEDNNVLIAYKKNLTGFTLEENWTNTITKIYPYATKDDVRITIPEKYVNSQYINRDVNPRIQAIDFTNDFAEDETITADALREKAVNYFVNTQCDLSNLNYNIEFVALSKTEEYKNLNLNEDISLFDTVIIRHELYGIDTKIKAVKSKYDTLVERYIYLELGFVKNNIANIIRNTNKKIDDTKQELKKDVKKANQKTDKLQVTMEQRDNEIELSVTNLKDDTEAKIEVLDGKIQSKVSKGDFGSLIEQNYNSVREAVKTATGTHSMTLDNSGVTIKNGGFLVLDGSGNLAFECTKDGYVVIKDIILDDVAKKMGSNFYQSLMNMEEVNLAQNGKTYASELLTDSLKIQGQSFKSVVEDILREHHIILNIH